MNKRICLIVTDAVSFNVLCAGQLEYLRDQGLQLTLVCGGDDNDVRTLEGRGVGEVIKIGLLRKVSVFRDAFSLLRLIGILATRRFDLVMYSTPKALLLGSIAAFVTGQPRRVGLIRGRVYENFSGFKRRIFVSLDQLSCALSSAVLFISPSLLGRYLDEGIVIRAKARVLGPGSSNGIDVTRFNPGSARSARKAKREELGFSSNDFVVLVLGRLCRDKGIRDVRSVFDLVKGVRNLKFLLVGAVEDAEAADFLVELQHDPRILHLGIQRDVVPLLGASDIHLFLTHREGFGNVAVEAAACGLPTVAYDVVGVRDSVKDGVSGKTFKMGDVRGVAGYIGDAAADSETHRLAYSGAEKWACSNFEQRLVWRRYLEFYSSIMSEKTGYV